MTWAKLLVWAMFLGAGIPAIGDDKGLCPPLPPKPSAVAGKSTLPVPPSPGMQYAGTVTLMAVISNTGYVCDAQVIRGLDKETNKKAVKTLRQWHLQPARKDGRTVPVVTTVGIDYWRKDGQLVELPSAPIVTTAQDKSAQQK
ncbi:MAG TPA: energy transducer TonB [Terriglobales bacterium]|nr:energy transducer TonB [Terriglobales bacterium]